MTRSVSPDSSESLPGDWIEQEMYNDISESPHLGLTLREGGIGDLSLSQVYDEDVPLEMKKEFKSLVVAKLASLLVPVIRRWFRKKKIVRDIDPSMIRIAENALQSSKLFQVWPIEQISSLIGGSVVQISNHPEVVLHQGESCRSGVFVLLKGSVNLIKKGSDTSKSISLSKGAHIHDRIVAPCVFNDYSMFTGDCLGYSVVSLQQCTWLAVPHEVYSKMTEDIRNIDSNIYKKMYQIGFRRRLLCLPERYPMSFSTVTETELFGDLDMEQCDHVISRLGPRCYKAGDVIIPRGHRSREMFFICNGILEFSSPTTKTVQRTPISINSLDLYICERSIFEVKAATHVDVWVLTESDFQLLLLDNAIKIKVRRAADLCKVKRLLAEGNTQTHREKMRELVKRIPIVSEYISARSDQFVSDLVRALRPRVFTPPEIIVSAATQCDTLLFVTKGQAVVHGRVGSFSKTITLEEALGFTCSIEHRWTHAVSAFTACETWCVDQRVFISILKKYHLLSQIQADTKSLINDPLSEIVVSHESPALYPTPATHSGKLLRGNSRALLIKRMESLQKKKKLANTDSSPSVTPTALPEEESSIGCSSEPSVVLAQESLESEAETDTILKKVQRASSLVGRLGLLFKERQSGPDRLQRKLNDVMKKSKGQHKPPPPITISPRSSRHGIVSADGSIGRYRSASKSASPQQRRTVNDDFKRGTQSLPITPVAKETKGSGDRDLLQHGNGHGNGIIKKSSFLASKSPVRHPSFLLSPEAAAVPSPPGSRCKVFTKVSDKYKVVPPPEDAASDPLDTSDDCTTSTSSLSPSALPSKRGLPITIKNRALQTIQVVCNIKTTQSTGESSLDCSVTEIRFGDGNTMTNLTQLRKAVLTKITDNYINKTNKVIRLKITSFQKVDEFGAHDIEDISDLKNSDCILLYCCEDYSPEVIEAPAELNQTLTSPRHNRVKSPTSQIGDRRYNLLVFTNHVTNTDPRSVCIYANSLNILRDELINIFVLDEADKFIAKLYKLRSSALLEISKIGEILGRDTIYVGIHRREKISMFPSRVPPKHRRENQPSPPNDPWRRLSDSQIRSHIKAERQISPRKRYSSQVVPPPMLSSNLFINSPYIK